MPDESLKGKIDLIPSTKLKTKISFIKEVDTGTAISYNQKYITKKPTRVATIPIGYADGVRRSTNGQVVINGKLANIIGAVCMDGFMVDVTKFDDVKIGTEVYIWDNENITIEDIAKECKTINYEILSRLAPRVVKEFV